MPTKINNQKLPVNFYRGWNRKPEWSQLIRMAGDQAAILCNELRWHLGKLGDVREEIRYYGSELGWMPRYQFGRSTLCMVHMLPGRAAVSVPMDRAARKKFLSSAGLPASLKTAIRKIPFREKICYLRIPLMSSSTARSLAYLLRLKIST